MTSRMPSTPRLCRVGFLVLVLSAACAALHLAQGQSGGGGGATEWVLFDDDLHTYFGVGQGAYNAFTEYGITTEDSFTGATSLKWTFDPSADTSYSYARMLLTFSHNWRFRGGYGGSLDQYDTLSFWAKADLADGETYQVVIGMGNDFGLCCYDTDHNGLTLLLDNVWTEYTIDLSQLDLTDVNSLFSITFNHFFGSATVFVDDIRYYNSSEVIAHDPPDVEAGNHTDITLPSGHILVGSVTDDGLPSDYTVAWTQQSGPPNATATIDEPTSEATSVIFPTDGRYIFRLTADDGELQASDGVIIDVNPASPVNQPPSVYAGADRTVSISEGTVLNATVNDDGLALPVTYQWTQLQGPQADIANPFAIDTDVTLSLLGIYEFQLSASDPQYTTDDSVVITVTDDPPQNTAPTVYAGPDASIYLSDMLNLDSTVTDDGLPAPYTVEWTKVSGIGTVIFGDVYAEDTTVSFTSIGTYVLRLTADDGALPGYDDLIVSVDLDPIPPGITTQPQDESVTEGQTATFSVTASGDDPISYQWRKEGVDIAGANSSTYVTPATTLADDGTTYDVIVSNPHGNLGSRAAMLTVVPDSGGGATPTSGLVGRWRFEEASWSGTAGEVIDSSGQGNHGQALGGSTPTAAGVVGQAAQFDGSSASYITIPNNASLQLDGDMTVAFWIYPENMGSGRINPVHKRYSAELSLTMETDGALSYYHGPGSGYYNGYKLGFPSGTLVNGQWQHVAVVRDTTANKVYTYYNGSLVSTLTPSQTSSTSADSWLLAKGYTGNALQGLMDEVVMYDRALSASEVTAIFTDTGSGQPQNTAPAVDAGTGGNIMIPNAFQLNGTVSDDGLLAPYTLTWTKLSGPGTATFANYTAEDTTVSFDLDGSYTLQLQANDGEFTIADTVTVTVWPANQSPTVSADAPATITLPATANLDATVTDDGFLTPYSLTWSKVSGPGTAEIDDPNVLHTFVTFSQAGTYVLEVRVDDGEYVVTDTVTITVSPAPVTPSISTQPQPQTVTEGQTATFSVTASGDAPLSYQWRKNGVNIPGATVSNYATPATTLADNGATYSVVVSNPYGNLTSASATLTVNPAPVPPSISVQPQAETVDEGQAATFSVTAAGDAPLTYQWRINGIELPGATASSYTTPATTMADNGDTYDVVVSNPYGSATSVAVVLTVNPQSSGSGPEITDSFTYPDGDLINQVNWQGVNAGQNFDVLNNEIYVQRTYGTYSLIRHITAISSPDMYVQLDCTRGDHYVPDGIGPAARIQPDAFTCYAMLVCKDNKLRLYRYNNGTRTLLATADATTVPSLTEKKLARMEVRTVGDQVDIECSYDGFTDIVFSDTSAERVLDGDRAGMFLYRYSPWTGAKADNWEAGTFGAAPGPFANAQEVSIDLSVDPPVEDGITLVNWWDSNYIPDDPAGGGARYLDFNKTILVDVDDSFIVDGNWPRVTVEVEYSDADVDKDFLIQGDTDEGNLIRLGSNQDPAGTLAWVTHTAEVHRANFGKLTPADKQALGPGEGDFRIQPLATGNGAIIRHMRVKIPYLQARCDRLGHIFSPGEDLSFDVRVANRAAASLNADLSYDVIGPDETSFASGTVGITAPNGLSSVHTITVPQNELGFYRCELELRDSQGALLGEQIVYAGVADAAPALSPDSKLAVTAVMYGRLGENGDTAAMLRNGGFSMARVHLGQTSVEKTTGVYTWDNVDAAVDELQAQGVAINLMTLGGGYANMDQGDPTAIAGYANFLNAAATRYQGQIDAYEVWNEEDLCGFWYTSTPEGNCGSTADRAAYFMDLLGPASDAIRAGDPDAEVILGGLAKGDYFFLDTYYTDPDVDLITAVDRLGIHPYTSRPYGYRNPADNKWVHGILGKMGQAEGHANDNGDNDKKIWITEFGWSTQVNAQNPDLHANYDRQAKDTVRSYLQAFKMTRYDKIFVHSLIDIYDRPYNAQSGYGILRHNLVVKPTYLALRNMAKQLEDTDWAATELSNSNDLMDYSFTAPGKTIRAIWEREPGLSTLTVVGGFPANTSVTVADMMGNTQSVTTDASGQIPMSYVSDAPIYISY